MHLSQILPSVFASIGLSSTQDFLGCGESPSGREVLFLIDGLGADAIKTYRDQIPVLAAAIDKGVVTTSFPTTTATSLATLTTGAMPGAHGMLGYTVRVPRSGGRVLNTLKWDERVDPQIWQPIPTLFEQARPFSNELVHHLTRWRDEVSRNLKESDRQIPQNQQQENQGEGPDGW